MINYEEAWFDLVDRIKKLHINAEDCGRRTERRIYEYLIDIVLPSVLRKQTNPYEN